MRNHSKWRLGAAVTALLAAAPAASAIASAPAAAPHRVAPARAAAVAPRAAQNTSENWAGYVVRQPGLEKIAAHFVVPTADCSSIPGHPYSNASVWAGLDGGLPGGTSTTIEQIGVDANCEEADSPEYRAWWEMEGGEPFVGHHLLPAKTYPVAPGDFIAATVTWRQGATFALDLRDFGDRTPATGSPTWQFLSDEVVPHGTQPQLNSAEAVVERPIDSSVGKYLCLTKFGTVDFQRLQLNGKPLRDYDAASTALTLVQQKNGTPPPDNTLAVPSAVSSHPSDAFSVQWRHYGTPRTPRTPSP